MPLIDERKKFSSKRIKSVKDLLMDFNYQYCFRRNLKLTPEAILRTILLKRIEVTPLTHRVPGWFLTISDFKWSSNPGTQALYPDAGKIIDLFTKENPEWNKGVKP